MKKALFIMLSLLVIGSMLLTACQPAPAAEEPVAEEEAPVAEEEAVVEEEAEEEPVATEEVEEEPVATEEVAEETPVEEDMGPKKLVLIESGGYTSLDPFTNAWHATPTYAVFGTPFFRTLDLKGFNPGAVESWTFAEDNMSMTLTLRQDVFFSDGTPVNAEAYKWNMDKYLDPELASPGGGTLRQAVESVEILDEWTIQLNLYAPFAYLMDELVSKEIASPTAYETLGPEEYTNQLISYGPFLVSEIIPDVSISYVKNPDYQGWMSPECSKPTIDIDELEIKYIADESVAFAALETGEVQVGAIPPQYLQQAYDNPNIEVVESVTTTTRYFGMNNTYYPFTEEGVRQALAYAIDREEINLIALEGQGVVLYQPLAPGNLGYNPAMDEYGMQTSDDPEMAKQMLDELGFVDNDGDGIREEPNGKKMEYELMFPADPVNQRVAETLQAQLLNIGINTYLVVVDGTLMRQRTAEGSHQLFTWLYGLFTPNITTYIFHSARIGASNRNHVNDPVLDALIEAQDQQLDPVKRQLAVDEVSKYLIDTRKFVPLVSAMSFSGYRSDLIEIAQFDPLGGWDYCDITIK